MRWNIRQQPCTAIGAIDVNQHVVCEADLVSQPSYVYTLRLFSGCRYWQQIAIYTELKIMKT